MTTRNIIELSVLSVAVFVLGGLGGIMYQANKDFHGVQGIAPAEVVNNSAAIKSLSSQVVSHIVASEKVTNIQGRTITLQDSADANQTLVIEVLNDAKLSSFNVVDPVKKTPPTVPSTIFMKDIKVGNNVNVVMKFLQNGQFQASEVMVLPDSIQSAN